jgi:Sec-independent protein translocase protein TatA
MWATLQVYETWYRSQGMVIAGTERFPRNNTRSLGNLMEAYQRKLEAEAQAAETAAAEADYQRQLEEANAERDAARRAQAEEAARNQRLQREVDEARAAAAQRLSNPPAPVTTTTTETTTEVVQPRPESPVVRVNFRINLPDGVVTRVETLDDRGSRVYDRRYAGYIPMNNYPEGLTFCLRLTWEGASAPDPWKVVRDVHDGMTVEYQNLEVR